MKARYLPILLLSTSIAQAQETNQLVDLLQQLTRLEAEVRQLRGEVERLSHENRLFKRQQNDLYADLDRRLRGVNKGLPGNQLIVEEAPPAAGPAAGGGIAPPPAGGRLPASLAQPVGGVATNAPTGTASAAVGRLPASLAQPVGGVTTNAPAGTASAAGDRLPASLAQPVGGVATNAPTGTASAAVGRLPASLAQPVGGVATNAPAGTASAAVGQLPASLAQPVGGVATNAPAGTDKIAYKTAFDLMKLGKYAEAILAYTEFLKTYPASEYTARAYYWLGEANYVTGNIPAALIEFNQVINSHPGAGKLPDAMLKVGYIHHDLKQLDEARRTLTELSQKFPTHAAARLAENRLQRMALESKKAGH